MRLIHFAFMTYKNKRLLCAYKNQTHLILLFYIKTDDAPY
jgi:hypothetical protein